METTLEETKVSLVVVDGASVLRLLLCFGWKCADVVDVDGNAYLPYVDRTQEK